MEQTSSNTTWLLIAFQALMTIAAFFVVQWIRRVETDQKDMRTQIEKYVNTANDRELAQQEKLNGYVAKEDFKEFRDEMRANFRDVFNRMDQMAHRLPLLPKE